MSIQTNSNSNSNSNNKKNKKGDDDDDDDGDGDDNNNSWSQSRIDEILETRKGVDHETLGSEKRVKRESLESILSIDGVDGQAFKMQFLRPLPSPLDPKTPSPLLTSTLYFDLLEYVQPCLVPPFFEEPKDAIMVDGFSWDNFIEQIKRGVLDKQIVQYFHKIERDELEKNAERLKGLSLQGLVTLIKSCKKRVLADFILCSVLPDLLERLETKESFVVSPPITLNQDQYKLQEPLPSLIRELIPNTSLFNLSDEDFGMELAQLNLGSSTKAIAVKLEMGLVYFVSNTKSEGNESDDNNNNNSNNNKKDSKR